MSIIGSTAGEMQGDEAELRLILQQGAELPVLREGPQGR